MKPEERVEKYLKHKIEKERGGICFKIAPVMAGLPDRGIVLPNGWFFFVETKAKDGILRPAQKVWHEKARRLGMRVEVLHTMKAIDAWLKIVDARVLEGLDIQSTPMIE